MTSDYLETLLIRIEARRESALEDCDANLAALLWDAKETIAKLKANKASVYKKYETIGDSKECFNLKTITATPLANEKDK